MRQSLSLSVSISQEQSHMQCCQLSVLVTRFQNKPSGDSEQMLETVLHIGTALELISAAILLMQEMLP